jgi:hypothetical protein
MRLSWLEQGSGSASALARPELLMVEHMAPRWPQGNGHADADGDDHEQSQGESNEKESHSIESASIYASMINR